MQPNDTPRTPSELEWAGRCLVAGLAVMVIYVMAPGWLWLPFRSEGSTQAAIVGGLILGSVWNWIALVRAQNALGRRRQSTDPGATE